MKNAKIFRDIGIFERNSSYHSQNGLFIFIKVTLTESCFRGMNSESSVFVTSDEVFQLV